MNELTAAAEKKRSKVSMAQGLSCTEYFVQRKTWMILGYSKKDELAGDLVCPTATCRRKIGLFALQNMVGHEDKGGIKCTCEAHISPAFLVFKSRLKNTI